MIEFVFRRTCKSFPLMREVTLDIAVDFCDTTQVADCMHLPFEKCEQSFQRWKNIVDSILFPDADGWLVHLAKQDLHD